MQAVCAALRSKLSALAGGTHDFVAMLRHAGLERLDAGASAARGNAEKTHSSVGFGAVFAGVRFDPDLCAIRIARLVGAYDAGASSILGWRKARRRMTRSSVALLTGSISR